jgi:CRISPR system Cascade subunit CasE
VTVRSAQKVTGSRLHSSGHDPLALGVVLFEGELRVVDADRFRQTLVEGIGPGKAYGCGLLSIGPIRA